MYLTKSSTPVIGWVAVLLGFIMNGIFIVQSGIGIENIGLCIILFTIVVNMLMTPLTIQQQKFSKLSAKMNPEIQAIQKKYKGKNNDQTAMAKMNEETQAVYAKYGVNPMGSCLQLIIQMPILFALYRVIWNIPAYVDKVKAVFTPLSSALMKTAGAEEYLTEVAKNLHVSFPQMTDLTIVDTLYKFKPANWAEMADKFPDLGSTIASVQKNIDHMNNFLGLNIADAPLNILMNAWQNRKILLLIGAVMIPVLAAVTQWLNAKLMTLTTDNSGRGGNDSSDNMANTMKSMNTIMPIMSAVFCLTLPTGLGIYWIAGAVIRSIQQVIINRKLDKINIDDLMKENLEKLNKKRAKQGLPPQKMTGNANIKTRNIDVPVNKQFKESPKAELSKTAASIDSGAAQTVKKGSAKPGSLASKAMMVQEYNEAHGKK